MLFLEEIYSECITGKELATYHDNFWVKKYFIPEKQIKDSTQKFKIAYLHPELTEAKNPIDRKSQGAMRFHIASQISSRSIADRTTFDEQGPLPMAYWCRSLPTSLRQVETCHQESFPLHVRKQMGTTVNYGQVNNLRVLAARNTSSSHLYCCAELHENLSSEYRSKRSTCVDHERATFCCVTR